jgi:hypothetical protein
VDPPVISAATASALECSTLGTTAWIASCQASFFFFI